MAPLLTIRVGDSLTAIHCPIFAEQWISQGCREVLHRDRLRDLEHNRGTTTSTSTTTSTASRIGRGKPKPRLSSNLHQPSADDSDQTDLHGVGHKQARPKAVQGRCQSSANDSDQTDEHGVGHKQAHGKTVPGRCQGKVLQESVVQAHVPTLKGIEESLRKACPGLDFQDFDLIEMYCKALEGVRQGSLLSSR